MCRHQGPFSRSSIFTSFTIILVFYINYLVSNLVQINFLHYSCYYMLLPDHIFITHCEASIISGWKRCINIPISV